MIRSYSPQTARFYALVMAVGDRSFGAFDGFGGGGSKTHQI